jgi:class 3 adenylate cyclase
MTVFTDRVGRELQAIVSSPWTVREGRVVPEPGDVALVANGAVRLTATYVYADMVRSSYVAQQLKAEVAATIIRVYLRAASECIKNRGGAIRSFDGDRVMGIFAGNDHVERAVYAAMNIQWFVYEKIRGMLNAQWSDLPKYYQIEHGVGVDTGEALIARAGVRGDNDLVSIGAAPNVAAKLSGLREGPDIYITSDVHEPLTGSLETNDRGGGVWRRHGDRNVGGKLYTVYATSHQSEPA